jgi:hypothetical protein
MLKMKGERGVEDHARHEFLNGAQYLALTSQRPEQPKTEISGRYKT